MESEPPYLYVRGNPVKLIDPSGLRFDAERCQRDSSTKQAYKDCVLRYYGLEAAATVLTAKEEDAIKGTSGCYSGPVFYKGSGYVEGWSLDLLGGINGGEVVYDFATMQRSVFSYEGLGANNNYNLAFSLSGYYGYVDGFRSNAADSNFDGIAEYSGPFYSGNIGVPAPKYSFLSAGDLYFQSPDGAISGYGAYASAGGSINDLLKLMDEGQVPTAPGSLSGTFTEYKELREKRYNYHTGETVKTGEMLTDILTGKDSPTGWQGSVMVSVVLGTRIGALIRGHIWAYIYDQIHIQSYTDCNLYYR